jgi:single-strand selective monofunctional uracil DNA glycosylase
MLKLTDPPVSYGTYCRRAVALGKLATLRFSPPVSHVYNPLTYAWAAHEAYLRRYAASRRRVLFLGMNPGPFGMVQCGVPFGEIAAVRDWLGIECAVRQPAVENPARPIEGFACLRSEVSGRRLWGLFQERFGSADAFFVEHFVANYCPLAFFDHARNVTPDKLPAAEAAPLHAACDAHLRAIVAALQPEWVIGVGSFAEARAAAPWPEQGSERGECCTPVRRVRSPTAAGPKPRPGNFGRSASGSDVAAVRPRRGWSARRPERPLWAWRQTEGEQFPAQHAPGPPSQETAFRPSPEAAWLQHDQYGHAAVTTSGCCPR